MDRGAWPDSVELRNSKRVMVTGAAGFLGRHGVAKLREHGATQFEVVDRDRYDLRRLEDIRRADRHDGASFDCAPHSRWSGTAQDRCHRRRQRNDAYNVWLRQWRLDLIKDQ